MVKPVSLHDPAHITSGKRKKVDDDDGSNSKKQRTRVSYSCGECHRRKQKCDRQMPCSHCVARKVPELCKAYTPGKSDQDINARLTRLEHIIETALPQFCFPGTPNSSSADMGMAGDRNRSPSMGAEDDMRSRSEEQDLKGGTFQSGKWYGNSASGSVATASVLEQLENAVIPNAGQERNAGDSFHFRFSNPAQAEAEENSPHNGDFKGSSIIESVRQSTEPSAADNLKSLVQECGVSPHKIAELLQELPPMRFASVLIDFYFDAVNWTRYPLAEGEFRASYTSICDKGVGANPADIRFLPLLFVVLAIAVRLAPEHIAGDARTRRLTSLRYYWSSRRSLLVAAAIQYDTLDMVLTRLLSARFLTFDRRITECWSQLGAAVRTAQALGLHRDGSPMGMDPTQIEYRRRIWSYLYHADRSYALVLGRPNAIQDDYTSTLPPLNIDNELQLAQICNPLPLTTPTPMTFVVLRHTLAAIIGRIVHHFQQVKTPSHYSDVLTLDDDLLRLISNLPPHYSFEPDTSLDANSKYIPVHRFLLTTEIMFIRISLHRPYLLRRLGSDRYLRSRKACFESAIKDYGVRKTFRETISEEVRNSLNNAYREFQTAMISGIYLVLYPKGPDTDVMHAILDGFMKDHEGLREMDETTRRELKTIEFLRSKVAQMEHTGENRHFLENSSALDASNSGKGHPIDAHLLLELQKSSGRPKNGISSQSFPISFGKTPSVGGASPNTSPSQAFSNSTHLAQSPTFQRLQHDILGESHTSSGSGSPSSEEESTAQSLLDHWCNAVSGGPSVVDTTGMLDASWGGINPDFSGWVGVGTIPSALPSETPLLGGLTGADGSDWTYWETLVNQIRGPVV